ncbi:MAG TPA: hypothetical protein VF458_03570 [Ktedonobacteraceae bacterium]
MEPLASIPGVSNKEQASWPHSLEVEVDSAASPERDTPASLNAIQEPGDTESTIQLPGKLTRRKPSAREPELAEITLQLPNRRIKRGRAAAASQDEIEVTLQLPRENIARQQRLTETRPRLQFARPGATREDLDRDLQASLDETKYEDQDQDDEVMQHHETWQKVVDHRSSAAIPAVSSAGALRQSYRPLRLITRVKTRAPRSVFWLGTVVLLALLLSSAFGLAVSFGRNVRKTVSTPPPSLQASPSTIALGGIITLRGSHFTPQREVALSRDQQISLVDTGGANTVQTDAQGFFSDTVVVDPAWLAGSHMLYAIDLSTHKRALVPVLVTGTNALQGPPHLLLSASTLDLGSGDKITNASKLLAISNAGGGQATWQASANQSWLSITPQRGSIASGKYLSALVAASRARLAPGFYQASIVFTSNTGLVTLTVTLTVTPLRSSHEAIMQVTPASLAFEGAARGDQPFPSTVTISNPGILPLTWGASVNNTGWLWTVPFGGTIPAGGQQQITVGVTTDGLSSGVYRSAITFSNQGSQPVQGAPQSIYVSLTVTPACTLMLSTGSLSFSGQHKGANPASQALSIGVASGCTSSQGWTASSSDQWLKIGSSTGTTPSTTNVSVNTSGLAPGIYDGTLTFANSLGSKMVEVTLVVSPIPCSTSGPSAISFQGTAGQAGLVKQSVTISTSGDCMHTLNWTATTSSSWLSAPASGSFSASTAVSIQADLSNLGAGTYSGTATIAVVDSVTNKIVGTLVIEVTLTAQAPPPPCALQGPLSTELAFTASAGSSPATPVTSFTIGVTGSCSGSVTITPTVDPASTSWLSVSGPVSIASGSGTTFTVTVASDSLASGSYTGTITLDAGSGVSSSPRTVTVTLVVQ